MSRAHIAAALTALLLPVPHAHAEPPSETMPVLATIADPGTDAFQSMTIAFDGEVFYFKSGLRGFLDRVRIVKTAAGVAAQPLSPLPIPETPQRITYDARRHALLLIYDQSVSVFDLTTAKVTSTKRLALRDLYEAGPAYDWSRESFALRTRPGLASMGATGAVTRECRFPRGSHINDYPSALLAAGNGNDIYLQTEDDATIYTVTRTCMVTHVWSHRTISESGGEDDSLACDGVTFGVPVIWIRDSGYGTSTATMTAYGLPRGVCLLPTALRLKVDHGVACATLTRTIPRTPLPGLTVRIGATDVVTDGSGLACADVPTTPGRHRVVATFAGTRSWSPSRAVASYGVPLPPRRPLAPPRRIPPRVVTYVAPVHPVAGAAAPPPPPVHLVPQPAPQPGYGNSPVSQAAPFGVAVPQSAEDVRFAYAANGDDDPRGPVELLFSALTAAAAAGLRRRTSISVAAER